MKKYLDQLNNYMSLAIKFITRYSFVIFLVLFAGMAGYLVTRIGYLARLEPSQSQIDTRVQEIKKTNTNDEAILKLKELEGRNISIEALFDNGRTNPFEN